jgi:hypothetical protein
VADRIPADRPSRAHDRRALNDFGRAEAAHTRVPPALVASAEPGREREPAAEERAGVVVHAPSRHLGTSI